MSNSKKLSKGERTVSRKEGSVARMLEYMSTVFAGIGSIAACSFFKSSSWKQEVLLKCDGRHKGFGSFWYRFILCLQ